MGGARRSTHGHTDNTQKHTETRKAPTHTRTHTHDTEREKTAPIERITHLHKDTHGRGVTHRNTHTQSHTETLTGTHTQKCTEGDTEKHTTRTHTHNLVPEEAIETDQLTSVDIHGRHSCYLARRNARGDESADHRLR